MEQYKCNLKKVIKKVFLLTLVCLLVLAPTLTMSSIRVSAASPKLNYTKLKICINDTVNLKIGKKSTSVKWSSSDKSIVSVNYKGKITAKALGNATITAKYKNKSYTCNVSVVNTFKVKDTIINITDSAVYDLSVYCYAMSEDVIYTCDSSDEMVATCSWDEEWDGDIAHLYIRPRGNGTATITISNNKNNEEVIVYVTVTDFDSSYYDDDDSEYDDDDYYDDDYDYYDDDYDFYDYWY